MVVGYKDGHFLRQTSRRRCLATLPSYRAVQLRQAGLGDSAGGEEGLRALFTLAGVQA